MLDDSVGYWTLVLFYSGFRDGVFHAAKAKVIRASVDLAFAARLSKRGHSDSRIEKILGKNFARVMREAWGA